MKANLLLWCVVALGISVHLHGAGNSPGPANLNSVRSMDLSTIPSDATMHQRSKWSKDVYIIIDDDAGAPSFYMFDKSGTPIFSAAVQIPGAGQVRIYDFASAPDGSIWACGGANSSAGQQSFFLARIQRNGDAQFVQTTPYRPSQIDVAPDGTVWTIGLELVTGTDGIKRENVGRDVLRHFDGSGKFLGSSVPLSRANMLACYMGHLAATQDRVGWYAPFTGASSYTEFSTSDMKIMGSYTTPAPLEADDHSVTWGFALTPGGEAYIVVAHHAANQLHPVLYGLNRNNNAWTAIDGVPLGPNGLIPELKGSDGESLIFMGPPDKSKLQVLNVSNSITR